MNEKGNLNKATILLVDDHPDNLLVMEQVLLPLGQNIIKATSGQEALKHIFKEHITVVVMDVTMPGMSGFETAALIRERDKSRYIPIIFVTGLNVQESAVFRGYSLGGVDYILKPIVPEILKAKVNVFVELHKKTEELLELNRTLEERVAERTRAFQQQAEELARSNAELEEFAFIVSHDLQEPIRKIINFSQLFEQGFSNGLDSKSKKYLDIIVDGAARMRNLILDLLKFSQVGRSEMSLKKVNVKSMIDKILSDIETPIKESKAKVEVGPMPMLKASPTLLPQLFQNLILNAIKFRGDKPPLIRVQAKEEKGFHVFSISDNGIGIAPQHWEKIFKIFHRLHTRQQYPGSGIGLSICKKIVERQGGQIWVQSELDHGSTFSFSLPSSSADDGSLQAGSIESEKETVPTGEK